MPITRIDPPMQMETPLGQAWAHFIWDGGPTGFLLFGCFQCETGENWWWPNNEVRMCSNVSMEQPSSTPTRVMSGLEKHVGRYPSRTSNKQKR